ncbi:MAG: hypothetical protein ACOY3J_02070, partial [Bacillota bacterium]
MALQSIIAHLKKIKEFNYLLEQLKKGRETFVYGVAGSQKTLLTAALLVDQEKPLLYIVENPQRGKEVFDDLNNLLPDWLIQYFPAFETLP